MPLTELNRRATGGFKLINSPLTVKYTKPVTQLNGRYGVAGGVSMSAPKCQCLCLRLGMCVLVCACVCKLRQGAIILFYLLQINIQIDDYDQYGVTCGKAQRKGLRPDPKP